MLSAKGPRAVVLNSEGKVIWPDPAQVPCDHGLSFDPVEARRMLGDWVPRDEIEFIVGNPAHAAIRRRWPRLDGPCPYRCGFVGIAYVSPEHYILGDW